MPGYMAVLLLPVGLPVALFISIAPRISRWTNRRRTWQTLRDEADAAEAGAWFARLRSETDDFTQTLAPTETLADYIDRHHPEHTRRAA